MAELLAQSVERRAQNDALHTYIARLLAAFREELSAAWRYHSNASPGLWSALEGSDRLVEVLSEREREVLQLIAEGASNQAIAATLVISIGTVKSHINHILGKLGAGNRTAAVARARELGVVI
jgi:LuxR family maltose regulon positive regulatory protein